MMPCIVNAASVGKIMTGKRVTMLHMDGVNTSPTFPDSTGKVWTPTSPTVISNGASKFGGTSMSNTGTTGRLNLAANSDLNFGTGDWTFDAWVNPTSLANANACLMATSHATWGVGARYIMLLGTATGASAGKIQVGGFNAFAGGAAYEATGNPVVLSLSALALNTWTHVAITKRDNTITIFINGVKEATGTTTAPWDFSQGGTGTILGRDIWDGTNGVFTGYMDEVRITKGAVLYSDSFAPQTTPYEPVNMTTVLMHFDGTNGSTTITDAYHAVSRFGNAQLSTAQSKFGGSSLLLDGVGDYLTMANSPDFNLSLAPMSFDMWIYPTTVPTSGSNQPRYLMRKGGGTSYLAGFVVGLRWNTTYAGAFMQVGDGTDNLVVSTSTIPVNAWTHVAGVYTGAVMRLYINGVLEGTKATATPQDNTDPLYIGYDANAAGFRDWAGYIEELRITRDVQYTSNFTPPTAAYGGTSTTPPVDSPIILMHMDGANGSTTFTDTQGHVFTAFGNAQLSTTSPKFGTASLLLDGTGDYIQTPGTPDLLLGSGDFTVEAWIKNATAKEQIILDFYSNSATGTNANWSFELTSAGVLRFYVYTGTANLALATGTTVIRDGVWHHVAACRSNGVLKIFLDGVQEVSVASTHAFTYQSSYLGIGAQITIRNAAYDFQGSIDEVRIIKSAMYTANFTPPAAPF